MATNNQQSRSGKPVSNKSEKDLLQDVLGVLLRDEDNKYCADCDAKSPRWASWNIGVFLCIRCAGIHRKLGVHISRVKSVNLDSWTPEQVAGVAAIGNSLARAAYEANVPDGFRRPQTDSALEQFIKAKYEEKRYLARDWVLPKPDPATVFDLLRPAAAQRRAAAAAAATNSAADQGTPKLAAPAPAPSARRSAGNGTTQSQSQPTKPQQQAQPEPQPEPPQPQQQQQQQPLDLLGGLTDDGFGDFSSTGAGDGGSGVVSAKGSAGASGGGNNSHANDLAFLVEGNNSSGDLFGASSGENAPGGGGWPDNSSGDSGAAPKQSMKDSIMALYASSGSSGVGGAGLQPGHHHLGGMQYSVSTPHLAASSAAGVGGVYQQPPPQQQHQQQLHHQLPTAALYSQAAGALYSTGGQFGPPQYGGAAAAGYQAGQQQQQPQPQQYYPFQQAPSYVNNQSAYLQQIQSQMASMNFKGATSAPLMQPQMTQQLQQQPPQLPQQQQIFHQQHLQQSAFTAGNFWN